MRQFTFQYPNTLDLYGITCLHIPRLYQEHLSTLSGQLGSGLKIQLIRFASVLNNLANLAKAGLAEWLCLVEKPGLGSQKTHVSNTAHLQKYG